MGNYECYNDEGGDDDVDIDERGKDGNKGATNR